MCGIAGWIGAAEPTPERIADCLARMRHRGPDHASSRVFRRADGRTIGLLHSRLSIIDLDERSHQPFTLGSRTIAYNGEIYDYLELRAELEARGKRFRTSSDTEVLLAMLDEYGWAGLDRCEGMWAFAVHDAADDSLALVRDRFGEKPLWLLEDRGTVFFGSEVKFLVALAGRTPEIDLDHVHRYLVNGYKALYKTEATFFHGVRELPPATILRFDRDGRRTEERYWTARFRPDPAMAYEDAVEGVRRRLVRAVEIRLRADVPLAFCMSGGVDSNALIGIASRIFGHDVHGFTVLSDDARYDEGDVLQAAIEDLGIRHTPVPMETGGFLGDLRSLVRHHDAPVYTITYFAHWRLMQRIAAHGYRISVSGTGADELFSGYYDHHLAYFQAVADDPDRHAEAVAEWRERILPLVRNPHLRDPGLFTRDPTFRDHVFLDQAAFSAMTHRRWIEPFRERRYADDLLRNRMMNELFHEAVPPILHEDDLNAMSHSIENRSPFLDRGLVEFAYSIPTRHLVRRGYAKAVLRDAVRGIAPDAVVEQHRKVGFNAPIFAYLDRTDEAVRREVLADGPIFEHVRKDAIARLLERPDLPNSESKFLFYFLCSKFFLEEFGA